MFMGVWLHGCKFGVSWILLGAKALQKENESFKKVADAVKSQVRPKPKAKAKTKKSSS